LGYFYCSIHFAALESLHQEMHTDEKLFDQYSKQPEKQIKLEIDHQNVCALLE
jgi:hypothetical protein